MKRKMALLMVLTLAFTALTSFAAEVEKPSAINQYEAFDFVSGTVTASILNVRQGPSTSYDVVDKLSRGEQINILGKMGDWFAVYDAEEGRVGTVHSKYVDIGDAKPVSVVPVGAPTASPKPEGAGKATPEKAEASVDLKVSKDEQAMLELINAARAEAKLSPLQFDAKLLEVARLKAKDMAENKYFSHQSPTYGSPFDMMRQYEISFKSAGENIAGNKTVEGAFNKWMKDETLRKNILNEKFNYTGIGIANDKTYGKVMVQMFIGR